MLQIIGTLGALREQVREEFRRAILELRLRPGQLLTEREIAASSRIPRMTVRQVLRELAEEGLVTTDPPYGAAVVEPSPSEAFEIEEVRRALEDVAVRRFVQCASQSQIEALRRALYHFERVAADNACPTELLRAWDRFYTVLLRTTGLTTTISMLRELRVRIILVMATSLWRSGQPDRIAAELRDIFESLEARDAEAATAACTRHIEHTTRVGVEALTSPDMTTS